MAYTAPTTRTTGTLITASIWNTDIVDNISAIWKGTTAGDMDYYTGATAKSRLAAPTAGYGLFHTGTAPAWGAAEKVILNDTSDTVKQSSDAGNDVYAFTLPAGTLGVNGMIGISGFANITLTSTDAVQPLVWVTFGSSNTSDGIFLFGSSDAIDPLETVDSWFDARLIAKGASSERLMGMSINMPQSGATVSRVENAAVAIDQSAAQEIRLLHTGVTTSDQCSFTVHDLTIYTVPYLTTT